jgi:hypothetical protein
VVLVGTLVSAEAGISVDPEDRPEHSGFGGDSRHDGGQPGSCRLDEGLGRLDVGRLVAVAVRVEPSLVVVATKVGQELDRVGGEGEPPGRRSSVALDELEGVVEEAAPCAAALHGAQALPPRRPSQRSRRTSVLQACK